MAPPTTRRAPVRHDRCPTMASTSRLIPLSPVVAALLGLTCRHHAGGVAGKAAFRHQVQSVSSRQIHVTATAQQGVATGKQPQLKEPEYHPQLSLLLLFHESLKRAYGRCECSTRCEEEAGCIAPPGSYVLLRGGCDGAWLHSGTNACGVAHACTAPDVMVGTRTCTPN